jgi:hypothetical protein
MKTYGRVEVRIFPPYLTSELNRGEWSISRSGRVTIQGNRSRYPLYRRLGGPRSQFELYGEMKNVATAGIQRRPFRLSLYRLLKVMMMIIKFVNSDSYKLMLN